MKYLILLTYVFFGQFALAADYSVSPLLIENTIEPRDLFEETVKITNTTSHKLRIFPTVNEITVGSEGEVKTFVPASMGDNTTSVTSWISVTRGRVEVNPGETIKIPVSFTINPNAQPGEYHAFIGFAEGAKRDDVEAMVEAGRAPGVVVRLSLVEKRSEYLRLNKFHVDRFVFDTAKSTATYDLENVGGQDIVPGGEIVFYNGRGVEVGSVPINQEGKSLSPGSKVTFTEALPALGLFGRHKALLNVEYGKQQRANLYDTTYFSIIPVVYLLIIFLVLLFVSALLAWYYHKTKYSSVISDHDEVSLYVRNGVTSTEKDHDINLKK